MTALPPRRWPRRTVLGFLGTVPLAVTSAAHAASCRVGATLEARIQEIIDRPEFTGSYWAMRIHSLGSGRVLYEANPNEPVAIASAVKVFHTGAAFAALGAGHRFRTRILRTGPIERQTLRGDLVLVAGGNLVLGGRVRHDGSVTLPQPDHSYGTNAVPLPGELRDLRDLARAVAARGVRTIEGRVLVDTSLFRQQQEFLPGGAVMAVSPMLVNDNIIDVAVRPGPRAGTPGRLHASPHTGYVRFVNEVETLSAADAARARPLRFTDDVASTERTRVTRLTGDLIVGAEEMLCPYFVPEPARYAETAFTEALRWAGVRIEAGGTSPSLADHQRPTLAEHASPPLAEMIKVMTKVSSNVHTTYWTYLIGAVAGGDPENAKAAGIALRRDLLAQAGLDPEPDGSAEGRYSPAYVVHFLAHLADRPYFPDLRRAFPIMGKDGSLADVQTGSPAAGHVFAKTGTGIMPDKVVKAMTGYVEVPGGELLAFMVSMAQPVTSQEEASQLATRAGQAQGEIATAVYESFPN